jgi:hypothetical protein
MLGKRGNRSAQHGGVTQLKILLGHRTAEPTTPTRRDYESVYRSHTPIYRTIGGLTIGALMLQCERIKASICLRAGQSLQLHDL